PSSSHLIIRILEYLKIYLFISQINFFT
ncbi:hypothetical protein X975_27077, partial [Stegodyphus mimosarum]